MELAVRKQLGRFHTSVPFMLPKHPGIDLCTDLGVNHIDGDRNVINIEAGNGVDVIRQRQSIRGKAQLDIRRRLRDQLKGLERLLRIGKRIAGARDA